VIIRGCADCFRGMHGLSALCPLTSSPDNPLWLANSDDPDQVVSFLCSKFSVLIDQVQLAEARHGDSETKVGELERCLQEISQQRRTSCAKLQAESVQRTAENGCLSDQLESARTVVGSLVDGMRKHRDMVRSLERDCEELSVRFQSEQRSELEAAKVVVQSSACQQESERLRARLRGEVEYLKSQLSTVEDDFIVRRDREHRCHVELRGLEDRLQEAVRCRLVAERRAEAQHEQVCSTLQKVTLYRERFEVAQHALARREDELCREDEHLAALRVENKRKEQECADLESQLTRFETIRQSLEAALKENLETRGALEHAAEELQLLREASRQCHHRHEEHRAEFVDSAHRLTDAEHDLAQTQRDLQGLTDKMCTASKLREMLEHDVEGGHHRGSNMQEELQHVFGETERCRQERDEAVTATDEAVKRLRSTEIALETARRRILEMESTIIDADAVATREGKRKEVLLVEMSQCREKMRGLRRRHDRLTAKAQELEKKGLRNSGSTAGFAVAAAAANTMQTPRSVAQLSRARSAGAVSAHPASENVQTPEQTPAPDDQALGSHGLEYIRHWIQLEESKLRTRPPPKPSPLVVHKPPQCAAALAALQSGKNPAEAVAVLLGDRAGTAGFQRA